MTSVTQNGSHHGSMTLAPVSNETTQPTAKATSGAAKSIRYNVIFSRDNVVLDDIYIYAVNETALKVKIEEYQKNRNLGDAEQVTKICGYWTEDRHLVIENDHPTTLVENWEILRKK